MPMPTLAAEDISVIIAGRTIPLQSRSAAIMRLVGLHQALINGRATLKLILDCGPGGVELTVQSKVGKQKVGR